MREGYIWVGVSAQWIGVDALKTWSPSRYGSLDVEQGGTVTDDSLCYDIYSQAGQLIKHPAKRGIDVLNGFRPKAVIATGESQSASRLATYANSIQPLAGAYDAIVALSNGGQQIRKDVPVPYWKVLTEYDVANGEAQVWRPDQNNFHSWEIAGTSHVDQHLRKSREALELRDYKTSVEAILNCQVPDIGTRTPTHYVLGAVFDDMVQWLTTSKQPPASPQIEVNQYGTGGSLNILARNSLGLPLGGIRLAAVDAPTGLNVRENVALDTASSAGVCWSIISRSTFSSLNVPYTTRKQYVNQVTNITRQNLRNGYILLQDAQQTVIDAAYSDVGGPDKDGRFDRSYEILSN